MSDLVVVHYEHDGTVISTFSPENLRFTLRKGEDGPHDLTYELSRSFAVEDMVGAYRTDFKLIDQASSYPITIMAGMHTSAPQVTTDEERIQLAGKDWLHYLEKRYWPYNDSDPNYYRTGAGVVTDNIPPTGFAYYLGPSPAVVKDSSEIVTDLLDQVLSLPNSLDLNYLLTNIGYQPQNFSVDIVDTENIHSKIATLSNENSGEFDFWVDGDTKEFTSSAPDHYQYDIGVVTDSTLAEYIFDTTVPSTGVFSVDYENIGPGCTRLIGQGANQSSTLVRVREYTPASDEFRLLEDHVSFEGVLSGDRVDKLTRQKLLFDLNPIHNVSITVVTDSITNFWTRFKPGWAIWIYADLEAHVIDAAFEIVSIDGSADLDGNMIATFNLNQIYTPATL